MYDSTSKYADPDNERTLFAEWDAARNMLVFRIGDQSVGLAPDDIGVFVDEIMGILWNPSTAPPNT